MAADTAAGEPSVLFIGGTGRSGTNITKDILARHPEVAALPFEYRFIIDPDGIADFYRTYAASWSPFLADRRLKRLEGFLLSLGRERAGHHLLSRLVQYLDRRGMLFSPRSYHGWQLDAHLPNYSQHVHDLMSELREFSFPAQWVGTESYAVRPRLDYAGPKTEERLRSILGEFVRSVITDFLAARAASHYVEDNTFNILFARELLDLVPGAKILHVYRDPRDVVASYTQQRWAPSDVEKAARWYKDIINRWFAIRSSLPAGSYREISLVSLVDSTRDILDEVCSFGGFSCHPALFEVALDKAHIGRWKDDFSAEERKTVTRILKKEIAALG